MTSTSPRSDRELPLQAAILCGGLGTRIRALAGDRPKSLLPVAGRPFIEHQLELLAASGVSDVVLCVGVGAEMIAAHVGDGARWGIRARYSREPADALRGTGGALVNALPLLREWCFVMYGDSYLPADYRPMARAFQQSGAPAMMAVYRNAGRWDASNARVEGGRVVFYSKSAAPGEADWIDWGLLAMRREVISRYASASMPLDLASVLTDLVSAGELAAWPAPTRFYEIGRPEGWRELEAYLRQRQSQ
ncbi:MAG: nucleotidyltransferase family protein [Kiritimatiellae bacterium]|nr:nucleotidyltransferase family protein [Kiritimatiellia bacterium]